MIRNPLIRIRYQQSSRRGGRGGVAAVFSEIVVQCVRQHVRAKRYHCATDKSYYDHLSAASVHTLDLQGGPMREAEVAAFRGICHLDAVIRVRWWDEAGKVAGAPTAPFEHYRPLLQRIVD